MSGAAEGQGEGQGLGPGEGGGAGRPPAPPTTPAPGGSSGSGSAAAAVDPRVAEVLQQLRSGVRLRQAEAAVAAGLGGGELAGGGGVGGPGEAGGGWATGGAGAGFAQGLLAVRSSEYVQEPVAFSHRPRFGRLIVGARKAFFHLYLKWFIRPVLAQQNAFNQAAGRLLQELAEANQRAARETRLLAARVAELEARAAAAAASVAAAAPTPASPATPATLAPPVPPAPPSASPPATGEGPPRR
jgi:hypothetical protein